MGGHQDTGVVVGMVPKLAQVKNGPRVEPGPIVGPQIPHALPYVEGDTGVVVGIVPKLAQGMHAEHRIDMSPLDGNDGFQSKDSHLVPTIEQMRPFLDQESMQELPATGTARDWRQHAQNAHEPSLSDTDQQYVVGVSASEALAIAFAPLRCL